MSQNNKVRILVAFTFLLITLAIVVYPLSVYYGEQTKDPDKYEALAWFASLGLLFLTGVLGIITLQLRKLE